MYQCYLICIDSFDGEDQWFCDVADENDGAAITEEEMFEDVRQALEEMGGGCADIINADTDKLYAVITV